MIRNTIALTARAGTAVILAWLGLAGCICAGCTAPRQAEDEPALSAVGEARMDVGSMQIAWIDSRASRSEYESGYEKWSLWVGVGFRLQHDASRPLMRRISRFSHSIWHSPRKHVEVEHLDGRPVELAVRFEDRHQAIVFYQQGGFIQRRVLSEDDQWSTQIAAATVGLGQRPEPGLYRMRFKAGAFGNAEGMVIDDSWHSFFIAEVSDDPTPQKDLPWYDLRVPPIEASRDNLEGNLRIHREFLGEQNRNTILTAVSLARVYISQEEFDGAEALLLEALDAAVVTFGEQHVETIEIRNLLQEIAERTDV